MRFDAGGTGECVPYGRRTVPLDLHIGTEELEQRTGEVYPFSSSGSFADYPVELLLWRDQRVCVDCPVRRYSCYSSSAHPGYGDLLEPILRARVMACIPAISSRKLLGPAIQHLRSEAVDVDPRCWL